MPLPAETGEDCNDGDVCTLSDSCQAGVCVGTPLDCTGLDGPCTTGLCLAGACQQVTLDSVPCALPGGCAGTCDVGTCAVDIPELCNGIDDNCNGATDETFPEKGTPCDSDDADLCAFGLWTCGATGESTVCLSEVLSDIGEVCNGQDDDCDGSTDEGFLCPSGKVCEAGLCVDDCTPVDGGWTEWVCGDCSVACGGAGTRLCTRECTNPPPSCGGAACEGQAVKTEPCQGTCASGTTCVNSECVDDPCEPDPCSGHGWCVPTTGDCICDPGAAGFNCASCESPWVFNSVVNDCRPTNVINGDSGANQISGSPAADYIQGLDGPDKLNGLDGDDFVNGNGFDDDLNGNAGRDCVHGGWGDDIVRGGSGGDFLFGGGGNDFIFGGGGNDRMQGSAGDDILEGSVGNDYYMIDGEGNDTFTDTEGTDSARCMGDVTVVSNTLNGPDRVLVLNTGGTVTITNDAVENIYGCN